jgi:pimeloyl-ACP methyl ester carboxylesterase
MEDYAAAVGRAARLLERPLALAGWSMGGLVVLVAAQRVEPDRVVLLEPSLPGELQGFDAAVELEPGIFDGRPTYGAFPAGVRSRPESALARAQRKRGISVARLACPSLVVHGSEFATDRGQGVAAFYGSDTLAFPELDHWGLVLAPHVRTAIAEWLSAA